MVRKFLLLFIIVIGSFNLTGCAEKADFSVFKKSEKVEVRENSRLKYTISKQDDIDKLINEIKVDEWKVVDKFPENLEEKYEYQFYNDVKSNEEVANLKTYEDSKYIEFSYKSMTFKFVVPESRQTHMESLPKTVYKRVL